MKTDRADLDNIITSPETILKGLFECWISFDELQDCTIDLLLQYFDEDSPEARTTNACMMKGLLKAEKFGRLIMQQKAVQQSLGTYKEH